MKFLNKNKILLFLIITTFTSCGLEFLNGVNPQYDPIPLKKSISNPSKITETHTFLKKKTQFDAFIAIKNDSILTQWGIINKPIMTHSARKSIISLLYGIAIEKGFIKLNQNLADLKIDESKNKLTILEKSCTIKDLLMSRSGIYLEASGETAEMKAERPIRGSHKPGEFYYYNNWGFNLLGHIFEKECKMSIGEAIHQWLAIPLGMESFIPKHVTYKNQSDSDFRQYIISMTAQDLARLGMLILQDGKFKNKYIVSKEWIAESTMPYSITKGNEPMDHYAYLWWVDTDLGNVWASGWGGQFMIVDRKNKLVTVSRNDTGRNFIARGLFMWKGKQGFRDHHQLIHEMMVESAE